ncbi:MAG: WYL domain-containing protein [Oscillospiraceae bacterium]|nr:WYL domain-containing protein [Oscillospiraceae bacterium]
MAKQANQKLKVLYLMKILLENTDENHALTMAEILSMLQTYDIAAERKSIYDDLEALRSFGLDIETTPDRAVGYYIAERTFSLPELKLLVDAVQSSKFITSKKSMELIRKIESFASCHEASQLQGQVFVQNRIKTMNESIYYNVDFIHSAISQNVQIAFRYFRWDVHGEQELRNNGAEYHASPWALTWDDENYYLVAFDEALNRIKHYRVDKMLQIRLLKEPRKGQTVFDKFDTAVYTKKVFGMYGGEEKSVTLRCPVDLANIIIDRFGRECVRIPDGDGFFTVTVRVFESPLFLSWVLGFGDRIEILQPASTREKLRTLAQSVSDVYQGG